MWCRKVVYEYGIRFRRLNIRYICSLRYICLPRLLHAHMHTMCMLQPVHESCAHLIYFYVHSLLLCSDRKCCYPLPPK
jgi:hypothetical protein